MDFTERMMERNRSRYAKTELKESTSQTSFPLKEVHHNSVTTIASTSGTNKVTIETTVTMRKLPKRSSNSQPENIVHEAETSSTEGEGESTEEKENECTQDSKSRLREDTKSRLQRLGVLYSDDPSRLSSPIHRTEEKFLAEEVEMMPVKKSAKSTARSARLAALADTINHWEDDLRHHPLPERGGMKSPTKPSMLTKHMGFTNKNTNEAHRRFVSPTRAATTAGPLPSILKRPTVNRTSPQTKHTTKTIVWDKTVTDALETKGFARSESGKRLIYDYSEEGLVGTSTPMCRSPRGGSPVKVSPEVEPVSPIKSASPLKPVSPHRRVSPTKELSPIKRQSPVKSKSPDQVASLGKERRFGSPIQMGVKGRPVQMTSSSSSDEDNPPSLPTMGLKQLRSPRNGPSSPGSVLNQVQMYERATSPTKKQRDPAELPLAQRKALFERNSAPVLPKAPFAMPVPINKLHSSKQAAVTKAACSAPSMPTASTGSSSSLHDRLALFEKGDSGFPKENKVPTERQKEMELLRNRWGRYKAPILETDLDSFEPSAPPMSPASSTSSASLLSPAPPPPPLPPAPQPFEYPTHSGYFCQDEPQPTPVSEKPEDFYPILKDVKKFKLSPPKPGCMYPCLSDMETESEVHESEVEDNGYNRSRLSESSQESDVSSLGQNIVRISRSNLKRDWPDRCSSEGNGHNEIDDFLDEALESSSTTEPTPPKRISYSNPGSSEQSTSFEYSNRNSEYSELKNPLLHSVSFYRRQNMTLRPHSPTRVVHCVDTVEASTDDSFERMEEEFECEQQLVQEKIEKLKQEVKKQEAIISQSTQALNLCYSTIEFSGSTEQLEAEKLLLVASRRAQALKHEIQRLSVEGTVRPQGPGTKALKERGSLALSHITVPIKMDVVQQAAKDDHCYYVLCLVHCDEQVLATELMCAPRNLHNGNKLTFPNTIMLDGLYSDFKVTIEVYTMTARSKELIPHDIKYHININKKEANKLRLTPKKGKGESKLLMPVVQSPGGPSAVRSSAFTMAGYVIFSLREVQRSQFTLNKNAYTSVLEGSLHLKIESEINVDMEFRSFLTMFEDVSGFGAWHRRWCVLRGDKLSYWRYPDEESKRKVPLGTIDLSACTTQEVDVVSRDVCARAHTFLLELARPASSKDVDSLVLSRTGNNINIRHLLSADTREERILWCQHLNRALALIRAWGVK